MNRKKKKGVAVSPVKSSSAKKRKVKVEADVSVEADLQIGGADRVGSSTML